MRIGNQVALVGILCALARCNCGADTLTDVPGNLAVLACNERKDPAPGVTVQVRDPGGTRQQATSDALGMAHFLLDPAVYSVVLQGGGPDRTLPDVAVRPDKTTSAVDVQCVGPRQLDGRGAVAGDLCNRHLGTWVEGARVVVQSAESRRETTSDAAGHFLVESVPAGPAVVSVRGPGPYVLTRHVEVRAQGVTWITTATQCTALPPGADCRDADGDGYGAGPDCIAADCNDADPGAFEGCLQQLPTAQGAPEDVGPAALPRIEVTPNPVTVPGLLAGGEPRSVQVTVRNRGDAVLDLELPWVDGPDESYFLVTGLITSLAPQQQLQLTVTAVPGPRPAVLHATLKVRSNDPEKPQVDVPVSANVGQPPGLSLAPACCEQEATVGQEAVCTFTVHNDASRPVDITALGMRSGSDPGFTVDALPLPSTLAPNANTAVRVRFTPPDLDPAQGHLQVVSELGQVLTACVNITVTANPPTAVPDVASVDGTPVAPGTVTQVQPLADVVLTSVRSTAPPGRTLRAWQWTLVERPRESSAALTTPTAPTTEFFFNSSGQNRNGLDVAGRFTVGLKVQSDDGQWSSQATLTLDSVPGQGIHVQLTWQHPYADMDLHLLRNGGEFDSLIDDCYYADCRLNSAGLPNLRWGSADQSPVLDVDDVDGYGPENIRLEHPQAGTYQVGVFYFATHQGEMPVPCTVKIFLGGVLVGTYYRTMQPARTFWRVANIAAPSSTVTVVDTVETP